MSKVFIYIFEFSSLEESKGCEDFIEAYVIKNKILCKTSKNSPLNTGTGNPGNQNQNKYRYPT